MDLRLRGIQEVREVTKRNELGLGQGCCVVVLLSWVSQSCESCVVCCVVCVVVGGGGRSEGPCLRPFTSRSLFFR